MERERDFKGAAFARSRFESGGSFMEFGDVFDNGQTEARSPKLAAALLVNPVEALKDSVGMFRADSDAEVAHRDDGLLILLSEADLDLGAFAVSNRVGDEVDQSFFQVATVSLDFQRRIFGDLEFDVILIGHGQTGIDRIFHRRIHAEKGEVFVFAVLALLECGQTENILHEKVEAF